MISKKSFFILAGIVFLTLIMFVPMTQAQQPIDSISCGFTTLSTILSSPELTIFGTEEKGINLDNLASKDAGNLTYHSVGVLKIERGKMTGTYYFKYMDPSGDLMVGETSSVGMEGNWKYLYGTGKYKGITGGGKLVPITKGVPISPGTLQGCVKITGTYELKK